MAVNDRVLIYQQTTQTENGIYVVTDVGSGSTNWVLTRSADADTYVVASANGLSEGSTVFVQQGATGAGDTYTCNTSGVITFGTTNITFAQVATSQIYSAGTGLTLSGTQFSITNTGTAGTYGAAGQVPVFTTNAQGQVTSVTNTPIAIAAAAVSGLAASATTDTTNANNITSGSLGTSRLSGSYTGITGVGTLTAGTWQAATIAAIYGGTGLTSFAAGDLIYANSSTTLAALADVAVGNALISGGVSADPSWGKIGLATHVDGTLPIANGGTGSTSTTFVNLATNVTGTLPVANGGTGNTTAQAEMNRVAGAVTSGQYLRGNGTNVVMSAIQAADVPTLNQNTTGNAATATTANALNTANNYTVNAMTVAQASPYYFANRTSISSGQVGIQLQTAGVSRWWMYLEANNDNVLRFYNSINAIDAVTFSNAGNLTAAGNVTANSDERLKTNWRDVAPDFVEKLAQVKSGVYDRVDQELTQAGVSAQSLQELLPETVLKDESGMLSVAYGNAALVACVELAKEVLKLRAEIEALKKQ
jgi:hypothetical protein